MGEHSPFSPGMIGPVSVRNRFIKAATFEGRSSDGEVSDDLIEFHRATAAGGGDRGLRSVCRSAAQAHAASGHPWRRASLQHATCG